MTVIDDRPDMQTTEVVQPAAVVAPASRRAPWRKRVVAITVIALAVVVGGVVLFQLFEGPFASSWYRSRQRSLTADFNATHPHVGVGHAIAIVQVPRLGVNTVVAEGDAPQQLRGGPAHRVGTVAPGALGNSVVLGHADDWGGPFSRLHELRKGDLIAVQTYDQTSSLQTGVYKVLSTKTTNVDDLAPFATSNDFRLTLIAGDGDRYSDNRLVVTAVSGDAGRVGTVKAGTVAETSAGSRVFNSAMLLALVGIGGAIILFVVLRRRYAVAVSAAIVTPIAFVGVLGLLLNIDLLLSPLR